MGETIQTIVDREFAIAIEKKFTHIFDFQGRQAFIVAVAIEFPYSDTESEICFIRCARIVNLPLDLGGVIFKAERAIAKLVYEAVNNGYYEKVTMRQKTEKEDTRIIGRFHIDQHRMGHIKAHDANKYLYADENNQVQVREEIS